MTFDPSHFRVAPSSGVPIFRQIIDQVHALIASGTLKSGDMLPSIRDLARELEVNMMTISKAYSRLETEGMVQRVRGLGMQVVNTPAKGTLPERKREFQDQVAPAIHRARQLGLSEEQVISIVQKLLKEQSDG